MTLFFVKSTIMKQGNGCENPQLSRSRIAGILINTIASGIRHGVIFLALLPDIRVLVRVNQGIKDRDNFLWQQQSPEAPTIE